MGRVPAPPAASWHTRPRGETPPPARPRRPSRTVGCAHPPKPRADSGKPTASSPQAVQVNQDGQSTPIPQVAIERGAGG
eukprot:gene14364-biopygen2066